MRLLKLEDKLKREWTEVLLQEEMHWLQKTRVDWNKFGDKNTTSFHISTLIWRRRNKVEALMTGNGVWAHDSEILKNMAVQYYFELFSPNPSGGKFMTERFPIFGEDLHTRLEKEYSMEETQASLKETASYKAPSLDGYQTVFFKRTWHLTGLVVHSFLQRVLEGGVFLEKVTEAPLILIPEETQPSSIQSFRPISLCNVIIKLATKMIMNRLKRVWKEIISPNQASFVPGRQSINNIVLCEEFIHTLWYAKSKKGGIINKLDLEIAYDRMEWH